MIYEFKPASRVILADDHPITRYGIRLALAPSRVAKVVGEANSVPELFDLLASTPCDIIVADFVMPDKNKKGGDGLVMVRRLVKTYPKQPVIVVTAVRNRGLMDIALNDGAKGWIDKGEGQTELAKAVEEVRVGRSYVGKGTRFSLTNSLAEYKPRSRTPLTGAEVRVLSMFVNDSMSLRQIAETLDCSYKIVSRHRCSALEKLGLNSDQELYEYCRWVNLADACKQKN